MWMFIGLLSFLGIFVFIIMAVISLFKKNGKAKRRSIYSIGCAVLFFIAIIADNSKPAIDTSTQVSKSVSPSGAEAKKNEEAQKKLQDEMDAKKKADAAKKKAEESNQTPQQKLVNVVTSAIGDKSDRGDKKKLTDLTVDEAGNIIVKFKINDNFSNNLIALGTEDDIVKILKAIKNSGIDFKTVTVFGSFPMQDKFGNSSESTVINIGFNKETVYKINFDNFIRKNIYSIADTKVLVHPDFISN